MYNIEEHDNNDVLVDTIMTEEERQVLDQKMTEEAQSKEGSILVFDDDGYVVGYDYVQPNTIIGSGTISMLTIRNEMGGSGAISLNDGGVRRMAGKTSGTISLSDLYGKTWKLSAPGFCRADGHWDTMNIINYNPVACTIRHVSVSISGEDSGHRGTWVGANSRATVFKVHINYSYNVTYGLSATNWGDSNNSSFSGANCGGDCSHDYDHCHNRDL